MRIIADFKGFDKYISPSRRLPLHKDYGVEGAESYFYRQGLSVLYSGRFLPEGQMDRKQYLRIALCSPLEESELETGLLKLRALVRAE